MPSISLLLLFEHWCLKCNRINGLCDGTLSQQSLYTIVGKYAIILVQGQGHKH